VILFRYFTRVIALQHFTNAIENFLVGVQVAVTNSMLLIAVSVYRGLGA